jgi:uncharacterized membrane protein YccC
LAYVLAELFSLPQGYWAVFSAIIIMQASVGGSVKATIDRVIGTIGGAVAGGAVGYFVPHESVLSLGVALAIALVPLTLVAALWPNYRVAPLTAVIVLLTPGAQQLGSVDSAFYRIVEITLGSFVGLGVSLVLLPARAHGLVVSAAARALGLLAICLAIGWQCSPEAGIVRASRSCRMIFAGQWRTSKSLRGRPITSGEPISPTNSTRTP